MSLRFNTPPGWPVPPPGWAPPKDWQPDPSWPPAPPGWQFWVQDAPASATHPHPPVPSVSQAIASARPEKGRLGLSHLMGGKKATLEVENQQLKAALAAANAMTAVELASEIRDLREESERARKDVLKIENDLREARQQLAQAKRDVVETNEIIQLQEAGIYEYAHPLANAVDYKDLLAQLKSQIRELTKQGRAVEGSTTWQVNGSAAQGRKMVGDFSKLLLRAYNAEADNCVRTVKPHTRRSSLERLTKAAASIERLGRTMDIHISPKYHQVRLYEIELAADYAAKVEEEREALREERERLRDEAAAAREIEREKAKLAKELAHYQNAAERMRLSGMSDDSQDIERKVAEIEAEMQKLISREANIRAGWVYVISNIGAFGERMVKIGMTRRLEPMDRIRELGDASVPFRYDVHALIFSHDAVTLERQLHTALADRKVNQVNNAREFFYATPGEVKEILLTISGQHLLEYVEEPVAAEWRASGSKRASDYFSSTEEGVPLTEEPPSGV